mgnify:CR=1 FL=1
MEYEILRRLFDVCGISESLPFYDAIEDTKREDRAFDEVVKSVCPDFEGQSKLDSACSKECYAYETQGFINGFRIGMILAAEVFFSLKKGS